MQLGVVGLGRMGANIVRRLARNGHSCVVFDRNPEPGKALAADAGAHAVADLAAVVAGLTAPRAVWIMLPAGAATESAVQELASHMQPGDVIIDGGQFVLEGRRAARPGAEGQGHPLSRHRDQWRRLGPGARLLPDDRRRQRAGRASRPHLRRTGARARRYPANAQARRPLPRRGAGISSRRAYRRRPFRQDDPQRHRIRDDAGLCRGLRHHEARIQPGLAAGASPRSRSLDRSPRSGVGGAWSRPGCST